MNSFPHPKHAPGLCPRCGEVFTCKSGNITQCACFGLDLGVELAEHIRLTYDDCLCRTCLTELISHPRDTRGENLHLSPKP